MAILNSRAELASQLAMPIPTVVEKDPDNSSYLERIAIPGTAIERLATGWLNRETACLGIKRSQVFLSRKYAKPEAPDF